MKGNISQARISQELRNLRKQKLSYLKAEPMEDDIYTWHFTIQGPQNSDFHQGLYHGQIMLPFEYPFKPPDMIFLNKNGRFQVNTKICLTITQYHPEQWNSAWTIRTMLEAVISLFNQNVQGIGYEEASSEMRKSLALKSHNFKCQKCGVLNDILKPRQGIKIQEKPEVKQELKPEKVEQQLEYASQTDFRRIKSQNVGLLQNKNVFQNNQQKTNNLVKKNYELKQQNGKQLKVIFPRNILKEQKRQKQQTGPVTNKNYMRMEDLSQKININEIIWKKVLLSQKWSTID